MRPEELIQRGFDAANLCQETIISKASRDPQTRLVDDHY